MFKLTGLLQQAFFIGAALMVLNFAAALLQRLYLSWVVLPKKEFFRKYSPDRKQWVDFITPAQNNEFKGLAALSVLLLAIGYFARRLDMAVGVLVILLTMSVYGFLAGLVRPEYLLTAEGLLLLNWYPPYMNRNMGFYPWAQFKSLEREKEILLLAGKKGLPLVCQEKDETEIRRYIRRHLHQNRPDGQQP